MDLRLPNSLKIFNGETPTIIFNTKIHSEESEWSKASSPLERRLEVRSLYYQVTTDTNLVHQILNALYQLKIQSVLVEGGARLLQSFIDEGTWDEARVITNNELELPGGLPAPVLNSIQPISHEFLFSDTIRYYKNL